MSQKSHELKKLPISQLRRVSLVFPGDLYLLAVWLMGLNYAYSRDHPGSSRRQTVHGLATQFAYLVYSTNPQWNSEAIKKRIAEAGLPLDAKIELDENIDFQSDTLPILSGKIANRSLALDQDRRLGSP